jgi:uncharacterized protein YndB with AHSA1/START domain
VNDDRVKVSVFTTATPARAFEVYTAGITSWWNPDHHVLPGTHKDMGVDPLVGGRLWDENTDGDICVWGRVLGWEPDQVFAFSWLVGPDWGVAPPDAPGSRVTVTFTAVEGGTQVDLVHDQIAAHGPGWEGVRDGVGSPGGWSAGLAHFAEVASQAVRANGRAD